MEVCSKQGGTTTGKKMPGSLLLFVISPRFTFHLHPSLRDDPKGGEEAMVWWIVEGYPEGIQFTNFPSTNWIPWSPWSHLVHSL